MLPYANYLKYLLSTGMDEKDIIAEMAELGFSPTRAADSIRNTMMLPPVFKSTPKVAKWMKNLYSNMPPSLTSKRCGGIDFEQTTGSKGNAAVG